MFKIAVRSYGRHNQIWKKTLSSLSAQADLDLGRQLVLAVTKEDYPLYKAELPEVPMLDMIIVPKGGHNATNGLIDYFPEGEQVIFMDDDISAIKHYTDIMDKNSRVDTRNLGEIFRYAFDKFDSPFGIDFTPNLMFKQGKPFAEFKMRKIGGAWWGAHTASYLKTEQSHEDDNIRTAEALHRFGGVGSINWLVANTAVGTNKGGMQASGDRGNEENNRPGSSKAHSGSVEQPMRGDNAGRPVVADNGTGGTGTDGRRIATLHSCYRALEIPAVKRYYQHDPVWIESMQFTSLRLRSIRDLRAEFGRDRERTYGGYLQVDPDPVHVAAGSSAGPSLEDFF